MNSLSEISSNTCLAIRCKAYLFHLHVIGAGSKLLCSKKTPPVSCHRTRLIGRRVVQRNVRVRNDCATCVAHNAFQRCSNSRRLGVSIRSEKQQNRQDTNPNSNITDGKRTESQNHLGSLIPINNGEKTLLVELEERRYTAQRTGGRTPVRVFVHPPSKISRCAAGGGDLWRQKAVKRNYVGRKGKICGERK